MTAPITNGEAGSSVRTKLNTTIAKADTAEADIVDLKAADNRRAYKHGVVVNRTGSSTPQINGSPWPLIGTSDFALIWDSSTIDTTAATKTMVLASGGANVLQIALDRDIGSNYDAGSIKIVIGASSYVLDAGSDIFKNESVWSLNFDRDGNATLYRDGVSIATVSISTSSAVDLDSPTVNLFYPNSTGWLVRGINLFNRALSAAEHLELSEIGIGAWLAEYPEDQWGGEIYSEDFATDLGSIALASGDETSTWTFGTNKGVLAVTATGTNQFRPRLDIPAAAALNIDHIVEFDYVVNSGTPIFVGYSNGGSVIQSESETLSGSGTKTFEYKKLSGNTDVSIYFDGRNLFDIDITAIRVKRLGALAAYLFNEGIGRQLRDLSGRYDALLSATGYQHMQPNTEGFVRVKGADANPAIDMLEASDIIPADSVVTDIIAEERKVAVANTAQDLADNRIRLAPDTGNLLIQRSDGTNHTTLGTVTAPTSLDDIDAEVHYKQVIR